MDTFKIRYSRLNFLLYYRGLILCKANGIHRIETVDGRKTFITGTWTQIEYFALGYIARDTEEIGEEDFKKLKFYPHKGVS